jgi:hypothetical protein
MSRTHSLHHRLSLRTTDPEFPSPISTLQDKPTYLFSYESLHIPPTHTQYSPTYLHTYTSIVTIPSFSPTNPLLPLCPPLFLQFLLRRTITPLPSRQRQRHLCPGHLSMLSIDPHRISLRRRCLSASSTPYCPDFLRKSRVQIPPRHL